MRVAGVQLSVSKDDQPGNLDNAEEWIRRAVMEGARIVCLQEFFGTGAFTWELDVANFQMAETDGGPTVTRMSRVSQDLGVWLLVPFYEHDCHTYGRYFKTVAVLSPEGKLVGKYRKQYAVLNDRAYEKFYFGPGNLGSPVFQVDDIKFGLMVCNDRHSLEVPRIQVLRGAHVFFVPTATSRRRGRFNLWVDELVALASSTGRYVVGVNSTGFNDGKDQFGNSVAVDPHGGIVAQLGEDEGMLLMDVDPQAVVPIEEHYVLRKDLVEHVVQLLNVPKENESAIAET